MKTKTKIWFGTGIVISVLAVLILIGIKSNTAFYMTVDEVMQQKSEAVGKNLKVSGKIVGDSVHWDANQLLLTFELQGEDGKRIPFEYNGAKPDTFNDGWQAIVGGRLQSDGSFDASDILVKCPSKYEALEQSGATPPATSQAYIQKYAK